MENIFLQIQQALAFGFIQRAIIAGSFIAFICSLLGLFLVLKRFALIGDGIAHVGFAAVALGLFLHQSPLVFLVLLVAVASLLILELAERGKVFSDTSIGIVSSSSVAVGVMLASLAKGFNADLFSYLFGNILAVSASEVRMAVTLSLIVLILVAIAYHDLFAIAFDDELAKASGVRTRLINRLLVVMTAITVVLGIRLVGTMLVSSLIILPASTALQLVKGFRAAIFYAAFVAVGSVWAGIFLSYILDLPTGATIVLLNLAAFLSALFLSRWRK